MRGVIFRLLAGFYSQLKCNPRQLDLLAFPNQANRLAIVDGQDDARAERMVQGKVRTPTEKPWIINFSEATLVEPGG